MTINRCRNMNDEKKCAVIIPFIVHPSIAINNSLNEK